MNFRLGQTPTSTFTRVSIRVAGGTQMVLRLHHPHLPHLATCSFLSCFLLKHTTKHTTRAK